MNDGSGVDRSGGRAWAAVLPTVAIGLLMAGQLVTPPGLDQPIRSLGTARAELATAGAHVVRLYVSTCLILLGLGALAAAFAAIALLCDRRGSALAAVSSVVAAGACVCGIAVNSLVSLNLAGATRSGAAPPGTDTLLVSVNTGPTPTAILATYIGGLCAASVLMAVALWRARAARWLAVLFPICLVGGSVSPPGPVGVLMSLPIATVMVLLGRKLWMPAEPARPTAHHTVLSA